MLIDEMKRCGRCRRELSVSLFSKDRNRKDGLQNKCKECQRKARPSRERQTETVRLWRKSHPGRSAASCRKWHKKHRSKRLASMKIWQKTNGNSYKALKKWRAKNPKVVLALNQARRFREKGADGSFTADEWTAKCAEYGNKCAYCPAAEKLTVHHVIPLAKKGTNFISNIVPACKSCNSSIGTKIVIPARMRGVPS